MGIMVSVKKKNPPTVLKNNEKKTQRLTASQNNNAVCRNQTILAHFFTKPLNNKLLRMDGTVCSRGPGPKFTKTTEKAKGQKLLLVFRSTKPPCPLSQNHLSRAIPSVSTKRGSRCNKGRSKMPRVSQGCQQPRENTKQSYLPIVHLKYSEPRVLCQLLFLFFWRVRVL